MNEKIKNFLAKLNIIETNYSSQKTVDINEFLVQIKATTQELNGTNLSKDQEIQDILKKHQDLLINIVSKLVCDKNFKAELRGQIILSISSRHELQINENAKYESKRQWLKQFFQSCVVKDQERTNIGDINLSETEHSKSSSSITLDESVETCSNSSSSNTNSLLVSTDDQKSGIADKEKKVIRSLLNNYSGNNNQIDRNYLHEVSSKFKLTPNVDVDSKVNSRYPSPILSRRRRDFIKENIQNAGKGIKIKPRI